MKKILGAIAQVSGVCCGTSPLFLVLGLNAPDMGAFFHVWFQFAFYSFLVSLVAIVAMQMVK